MAWKIRKVLLYFKIRFLYTMIVSVIFSAVVYSFSMALKPAPEPLALRILDGTETIIAKYPFMASMQRKIKAGNYVHICGGAIIKSTAILSAAHCFVKEAGTIISTKKWQARVGSSFTTQGGNVYKFHKIYVHMFKHLTKINDIAVIQTSKQMALVKNAIAPVTLASQSHVMIDGEALWIVGWGRSEPFTLRSKHHHNHHTSHHRKDKQKSTIMEEYEMYDNTMRQLNVVMLEYLNNAQCNKEYEYHRSNLIYNTMYESMSSEIDELITQNMLCGCDKSQRGVCTGDSGGPVIHNGVLVGLVSWSAAFCNSSIPVVSTRVNKFLDWIEAVSVP